MNFSQLFSKFVFIQAHQVSFYSEVSKLYMCTDVFYHHFAHDHHFAHGTQLLDLTGAMNDDANHHVIEKCK